MTTLSAWCSTAPGVPRHDAQHRVCAMRLKAGLLPPCSCPDHGGCQCGVSFCCGCLDHPAGKPWGWAVEQWDEHDKTCPDHKKDKA